MQTINQHKEEHMAIAATEKSLTETGVTIATVVTPEVHRAMDDYAESKSVGGRKLSYASIAAEGIIRLLKAEGFLK
jgi:predicted deacylase